MTPLASYAWLWMKIVGIFGKMCMLTGVCLCHVNGFLLTGFPQGIVANGYHQEDPLFGKPAAPASLCCAQRVFINPPEILK